MPAFVSFCYNSSRSIGVRTSTLLSHMREFALLGQYPITITDATLFHLLLSHSTITACATYTWKKFGFNEMYDGSHIQCCAWNVLRLNRSRSTKRNYFRSLRLSLVKIRKDNLITNPTICDKSAQNSSIEQNNASSSSRRRRRYIKVRRQCAEMLSATLSTTSLSFYVRQSPHLLDRHRIHSQLLTSPTTPRQ